MRQETLPKTRKAPIPTGPIGTRRCTGTDWVVYAKTPMGGPAQVLEYLARYTHRTAIGNERIASVDADQVAFKVRADDAGAKRMLRLDGVQFVRRVLLHVLPTGVKRIRHYGLLAPCKTGVLAQARQALCMPIANPQAVGVGSGVHAPCSQGGRRPVLVLPWRSAASGGDGQRMRKLASTRYAPNREDTKYRTSMT